MHLQATTRPSLLLYRQTAWPATPQRGRRPVDHWSLWVHSQRRRWTVLPCPAMDHWSLWVHSQRRRWTVLPCPAVDHWSLWVHSQTVKGGGGLYHVQQWPHNSSPARKCLTERARLGSSTMVVKSGFRHTFFLSTFCQKSSSELSVVCTAVSFNQCRRHTGLAFLSLPWKHEKQSLSSSFIEITTRKDHDSDRFRAMFGLVCVCRK